ncbi:MAG: 50S ribosomal protein L24 [Candidatus Omnitrophota bacterium]|jgi:large subunit ribosomal protein L24
MRLKKNDQVEGISGKDRGKRGRVFMVFPKENKVLIEKINYQTVYLRKSQQNPKGGITKAEGKLDASKVQLICPRTGQRTKVGWRVLADGTKHRISKKSGEMLGA